MREYATPAGFRAAVEATLRERARRLEVPAYIIRRQATLERLIVRLTTVAPAVSYRREAQRLGLATDLDDVHRLLGAWLDPVLAKVRAR